MATIRHHCTRCGTHERHEVTADNGHYVTARCPVCGTQVQLPTG